MTEHKTQSKELSSV